MDGHSAVQRFYAWCGSAKGSFCWGSDPFVNIFKLLNESIDLVVRQKFFESTENIVTLFHFLSYGIVGYIEFECIFVNRAV